MRADITPSGDVDPADHSWWIGGGDSSTNAYIGNTAYGSVTVNLGSDLSSWFGYIGLYSGSTGVVTVDGSGSIWTNSSYLYVGISGQGTLNITNGGAVSNIRGYIGERSGSVGVVAVDGSGSTWTNGNDLYVGCEGQGTLNITNGGAVSNSSGYIGYEAGVTGVVTVDGSGSTWTSSDNLSVGRYGHGTLNITNGGAVSNGGGNISGEAGFTGVVTVDGAGSTWTNGGLCVGSSGHGTLNITNGGAVVSNTDGYVGSYLDYYTDSTGVVTVDGVGSTWTNSGNLYVGGYYHDGQGTLNITDGGAVSNSDGYIGHDLGSTSEVTVDGAGSTWTNSAQLYVGYSGQGTLTITNGGVVNNSHGFIGRWFRSTGVVTVTGSGSTWTNSGDLYVGSGGTGELTVRNGGSVDVGNTLKIWGGGTLNMGATGQVTVGQALVLAQDSTLTADAGATIHMTGSAFQNESTNPASLAGLGNLTMIFEGGSGVVDPFEAAGEDMGAVAGGFVTTNFLLDTLQLGGVAAGRIQLVDNFDNQDDGTPGDEAVYVNTLVMNAGATIDLNGLNLYYFNGSDPKQFFCGDATLDGYVDVGDLGVLAGNYGLVGGQTWATGDFNGDGNVDVGDLGILAGNYGESIQTTTIPEPATLTLLGLGACLPLLRKRSR